MSNEFKPMKFGCGRYVQAPGALEIVGREAAMLKSKKALIVGGKQALDSVGAKMEESLKAAGVEPYFYTMTSDCTYETLDYLQNTLIPQQKFDLVIGSGGGKVVDMAVQMDIVQKSGSWFSMGDERIGQGKDSVKTFLMNIKI